MSKNGFSYTSNEVDVNKKITIVASKWNAELVNELIESGRIHLESLGFTSLKLYMFLALGSLSTQLKKN